MRDSARWCVHDEGSRGWVVTFPGAAASVDGFADREEAHAWILDYLIEYMRMSTQTGHWARERAADREARRQTVSANILAGLELSEKRH